MTQENLKKDVDQIATEVVQYILNIIEKADINHGGKLGSPVNETPSTSKSTLQPIHLAEIGYDCDDENDDDFEGSVVVVARKTHSNNGPSTSNSTTNDENQASGNTTNDNNISNDSVGRNNQLQEEQEEDAVESHTQGNILASPLFGLWETDEYFREITIDDDNVIDDRITDQDHVKERILYCDSCIKTDADTSESGISVACLCFYCEKYLCRTCSMNCTDAGHLIAQTEDSESERGDFCRTIVEKLSSEDDASMIARMNHERFVCTGKVDAAHQDDEPNKLNITGMCYTEDGSRIALIDEIFLKLFNGYSYKLIRVIEFSDKAYGVTELPRNMFFYYPESASNLAITFPDKGQIILMNVYDDVPIKAYVQLDEEERELWPRDINYIERSTLMVLCRHTDDEPFSIEIVVEGSLGPPAHIGSVDIKSLQGPVTADKDYFLSVINNMFISDGGYVKHIRYDNTNIKHVLCKALVSNPAVDSVICVDKKKNVFASRGNESHENGIYKSDEYLKIWKLCIPASEYMAGNSTLGMVHKDRLFLLTKSEDGRQYITIFQNEVSDRDYGEGSPL